MNKVTFVVSTILLLAGCQQVEKSVPVEGDVVRLRICADYPAADGETKVTLNEEGSLEWSGTETATLIFGVAGTNNSDNPTIPSTSPGVFEGEITIPDGFTIDNLQGIVVPAENGANFRGNHSDGNRIRMIGYSSQNQPKDNVVNPKYCPFCAKLASSDLVQDGTGVYTIPSLTLDSGHDLIRFNVYGKHEESKSDELIQSVFVQASDRLTSTFEYNLEKSGFGTNGTSYGTVTLDEPALLPVDKENGVKMFMGVALSGSRTVTKVVVTTDKAVYTKEVSQKLSAKADRSILYVYPVNLDLSTFSRKDTERENYYKRKVISIAKRSGLPSIQVTYTKGDDMISFVGVNEDFYAEEGREQEYAPLTTTTVYQACSMSKVPLAYIAMKMVEEGILDLMKPVYQYYGAYSDTDELTDEEEDEANEMLALFADSTAKAKAKLITSKMILLHTTGLDNSTYSGIRAEDDGDSSTWEWTAEPGYTTYVYSGPAVHILDKLLGKILGGIYGDTYDDLAEYAEHYIFNKVGIEHASYVWKDEYSTIAAKGHRQLGNWGIGASWTGSNAAYTLRTSTEEYTKFLKWINKGADFEGGLESEYFKAMFEKYDIHNDTETSWQGYVWRIEDNEDIGLMYHHRGNNGNYKGWMCTIPDQDVTLVFMTNGITNYNFYQAVAELFLGASTKALASTGSALPAEESDTVGNAGQLDVEIED